MTHTLPLPDFTNERVEVITGRRSGLFIAVVLHSSVLGAALGGVRLWAYPRWSDALGDALRLSAAMILKNAAGLDAGGGKSVIGLAEGQRLDADQRRGAFLDLGDTVESSVGSTGRRRTWGAQAHSGDRIARRRAVLSSESGERGTHALAIVWRTTRIRSNSAIRPAARRRSSPSARP